MGLTIFICRSFWTGSIRGHVRPVIIRVEQVRKSQENIKNAIPSVNRMPHMTGMQPVAIPDDLKWLQCRQKFYVDLLY